jgi:NAD-dependent SIR2 family protein deacetylase
VDEATMRARRIPRCRRCQTVARPNILMFGDGAWLSSRTDGQESRFDEWVQERAGARLVIVELGAGSAIPTIRWHSERLGRRPGATVIRVNPREPEIGAPHLSLASGARAALEAIDVELRSL